MPFSLLLLDQIKKNSPMHTKIELRELITDQDIQALTEAALENTHLKTLVLCDSLVGDEGARLISCIPSLEKVSLIGSNIGDEGVSYLTKMHGLKCLHLEGNKVGDRGAKELAKNADLVSLILLDNFVTDIGAKEFLSNTTLSELILDEENITPAVLENLEEIIKENKNKMNKEKKPEVTQATEITPPFLTNKKHNLQNEQKSFSSKKAKVSSSPSKQSIFFPNSSSDSSSEDELSPDMKHTLIELVEKLNKNPKQCDAAASFLIEKAPKTFSFSISSSPLFKMTK